MSTYAELFAQKEREYGLPAGYLARTAQIESSMNPNAKNPKSSAGGLFQFIDSTAKQYGLKNRYDPYEATDAAARLARDNMQYLGKKLGRGVSAAELYLAHQQGAGGAEMLLKDPNRRLGGDAINLNGGYNGQTAGAFANQWIAKFDGGKSDGATAMIQTGTLDDNIYVGVQSGVNTAPSIYDGLASLDEKNPYGGFWETVGAEMRSSSWTSHFLRTIGEDVDDFNYTPSQVFGKEGEGLAEFPEMYHDMLLEATSKANAEARMAWVKEDMVRRQKIEAGGWTGTAAGLTAGILDPLPLLAGIATGGIGVVGRGGLAVKAAVGAASGAAFNAGMEIASQELHSNPYADPLMATVMGAAFGSVGGILARNPGTADAAESALLAASRAARGKPHPLDETALSSGTVISPLSNSVGAAQNPYVQRGLAGDGDMHYLVEMGDESAPRGFGGKADFGVSGQMLSDPVAFVRHLGAHLFDPAAGLKGNAVAPDSVNTVQLATERLFTGRFINDLVPARKAYLKELGIWNMNQLAKARAIRDFNEQVSLMVENPKAFETPNPHVARAAASFQKGMADWVDQMREAGIADLDKDAHYVPKIANHEKIADLDQTVDEKVMHRMLEEAIMRHSPQLSGEIAKKMAVGYWRNLRMAAYGMGDDIDASLATRDKAQFAEALKRGLGESNMLDEAQVDEAFEIFTQTYRDTQKPKEASGGGLEPQRGISHLKRRTLLDYNEVFTFPDGQRLAVRDLFEKDAELLFKRYTRTMSGRYAFAKMKVYNPDKGQFIIDGVRSEAEWGKVKDGVLEAYRQKGLTKDDDVVKNTLQNLDFAWKRINGIPVYDNSTQFNRWARRVKDIQFARLMSNMGLNQIQEFAKTFAMVGPKAFFTQVPALKTMINGVRTGEIKGDQLLEELMDMTGIGMDGLHARSSYKLEDDRIGTSSSTKFEKGVDHTVDFMKDLTTSLSGMRAIHDFQQRWALKSITQQMADMGRKARNADGSFDYSKVSRGDRDRLATMGLSESDAALLFRNLLDNAEFDGKKIVGTGATKWDAEALTKYRYFVNRYVDRLVQKNDYGALSKWMSHPVLSMFVQFRSFVYGAWAKSTLWAVNHGALRMDPKMVTMILGELAMGTATYLVRNAGAMATEAERDKFAEEKLNAGNLFRSGVGRTATASIVPMMIDSALQLGNMLGFERAGTEDFGFDMEPMFGNVRSSGTPSDAFFGSPAVDQLASLQRAFKGANQSLFGDEEWTQQNARDALRALPIPTNFLPLTAALSWFIQDLPEK